MSIFRGLIDGVATRGPGGVLYVNFSEETQGYLFPDEFSNPDLKEHLRELVSQTDVDALYVVEERDCKMHVLAYPRKTVEAAVATELQRIARASSDADTTKTGAGTGSDTVDSGPDPVLDLTGDDAHSSGRSEPV